MDRIVDIESVLVDATCINGGGYLEEILVDAVASSAKIRTLVPRSGVLPSRKNSI